MADQIHLKKHIEDAHLWIDEIALALEEYERKDWAFNALRGVLFALRDRLTHQELFHFSAQLPTLIRGIYFEGYRFHGKPEKYHADDLLERIANVLGPGAEILPERAFGAVLKVLFDHVSTGELQDIYATMPDDIKKLWDESMDEFAVEM